METDRMVAVRGYSKIPVNVAYRFQTNKSHRFAQQAPFLQMLQRLRLGRLHPHADEVLHNHEHEHDCDRDTHIDEVEKVMGNALSLFHGGLGNTMEETPLSPSQRSDPCTFASRPR